ncbi:MAG TPA: hypothetical protein VF139_04985, partial [Candidatus Polarisedimenticolaceae bacterium]
LSDTARVDVLDVPPTVTLDKSASPLTLPEPGGVFTYTLTVTNTSVEAVTIGALTDTNTLSAECLALVGTTLAPGASASCTYTVTRTDSGVYPNQASVTVSDDDGNSATATDNESVTVTEVAPVVDITKTADPTTLPEPRGVFTFTLAIANGSVEPVTITALGDTNALSAECLALIGQTLAVGETKSCTYPVTHTESGSYSNTATVTVTDDDGETATDTDDETVTVTDVLPTVTLDKSVTPSTMPEPGGDFTYTLTVTNTSVEAVTIGALTDDNPLSAECQALVGTTLASGASASCTYTVTRTDSGVYPNHASVTVTDNDGNSATAADNESVTVTEVAPVVDITKTADPTTRPEPGGVFTFTLAIVNGSVEPVTIAALGDTNALSAECLALIGQTLAVGETKSCTYPVTHTESGSYSNTATVTVTDDDGETATDTDDETVTVTDEMPTIDLAKDVTPASLPEPGGAFQYTLTITNNSVEDVTITALTDDNALPAGCTGLIGDVLAPGASVSCNYDVTHTESGTYPNTASVTVSDNEGNTASDSDNETVSVVDVLPTVDLTKSVSPSSYAEPGGTFTFTLTVKNTSPELVTITALTDDYPLPAACTGLIGQTLAAGQTKSCIYTVPHANAGIYTNTASVTVADNESNTASDTDDETVTVTNVAPAIRVDKTATPGGVVAPGGNVTFTVVVTNLSNSSDPVTITSLVDDVHGNLNGQGSCIVPQLIAPSGSYTCSFTAFVGVPAGQVTGSETDTVTASGTDDEGTPVSDSDDATVTISPPIAVTDSSLCIFDFGSEEGRQWKRLFTPAAPNYKFTATNPGQFFYNLSVTGTPGQIVDVTITLPWPFVTQGAMPIHVYESVSFTTNAYGETCFVPGNAITSIPKYVTLNDPASDANYLPLYDVPGSSTALTGYLDGVPKTASVTFQVTIPQGGFVYINQHLDDGLKGPQIDLNGNGADRYLQGSSEVALDPLNYPNLSNVLIPEMAWHEFCTSNSTGFNAGCDQIQNDNTFKKNPGVAGAAQYAGGDKPAKGLTVELVNPNRAVVGTAVTDSDGFYQITYKHKGKAAQYTVRFSQDPAKNVGCTQSKVATLKGNGYDEAHFSSTMLPEDNPAVILTCTPAPQGGPGGPGGPGGF